MLEVTFDKERETKNAVCFEERAGNDPPMIGTLYLHKGALRRLEDPTGLRVRIEPGEPADVASSASPDAGA